MRNAFLILAPAALFIATAYLLTPAGDRHYAYASYLDRDAAGAEKLLSQPDWLAKRLDDCNLPGVTGEARTVPLPGRTQILIGRGAAVLKIDLRPRTHLSRIRYLLSYPPEASLPDADLPALLRSCHKNINREIQTDA